MHKLKIFIGASTEYAELATKLAACMENYGKQASRWSDEGLFPAGEYTWDRLRQLVLQFDAAIFIFGQDDKIQFRDTPGYQPRDNVLIEFGLFSGLLPRKAVVFYRVGDSKTAIDLAGLTYIEDKDGSFGPAVELAVKSWLENLSTVVFERPVITSIFPIIEFKADEEKVPRVYTISDSCKQFYGYSEDANLIDKSVEGLRKGIQNYIDPPAQHWDDFERDQDSILEKYKEGRLPLAQVPVRFNLDHPYFPGRTFVPLIIERAVSGANDITRVLYLDTVKLPRGVFGEPIWTPLSQGLDLEKLAVELKQMAENWRDAAPERVDALKSASAEAANGGSVKVISYCGEAGFFSLRDLAQKGSYPNAKLLLRRLLGLTRD